MMSWLRGANALVRERLEPRAVKARANATLVAVIRSFAVLVAALREIFDENAYQRFLDRSRLQSSTRAYAMFRQEHEQARFRRPRCC